MKNDILVKVTSTFNKVGIRLKKHSPEILVVAGVIGTVASAVMACKATTKISGILEETNEQMEHIRYTVKAAAESEDVAKVYSTEDAKKDTAIVYIQTGVKLAKLYAPAVALGALSITSILTSNNILRKRNIALAAAYATVEHNFKDYRNRVIERFGEEVERQIKHNVKAFEVKETIVDENGEEKTVTKMVETVDPNEFSEFSKFFDEGNPYWDEINEYNLMFLRTEQQYANDKLRADGFLFLNDVYERLGIPKTKAGQINGWVYSDDNPIGDNYVDFGIYDYANRATRDFVNGYEPVILLDFNVDGPILDLI